MISVLVFFMTLLCCFVPGGNLGMWRSRISLGWSSQVRICSAGFQPDSESPMCAHMRSQHCTAHSSSLEPCMFLTCCSRLLAVSFCFCAHFSVTKQHNIAMCIRLTGLEKRISSPFVRQFFAEYNPHSERYVPLDSHKYLYPDPAYTDEDAAVSNLAQ